MIKTWNAGVNEAGQPVVTVTLNSSEDLPGFIDRFIQKQETITAKRTVTVPGGFERKTDEGMLGTALTAFEGRRHATTAHILGALVGAGYKPSNVQWVIRQLLAKHKIYRVSWGKYRAAKAGRG